MLLCSHAHAAPQVALSGVPVCTGAHSRGGGVRAPAVVCPPAGLGLSRLGPLAPPGVGPFSSACAAHAVWGRGCAFLPPGGSLCYCTCAQEAISTKSAGRKWLVSGLEDHRYLSVTKSATRREPVGGTPTSKQEPCSGMHLMLSLSAGPWICHITSRVQVCTDSNGNAESPSPRAGGPTGMGCEGSPRGVCADSIGKS